MILMLLPLDMLVSVYMHVISAILIFGANILSQSYIQEEIEIAHNNGEGKGPLYDSHIEFMKAHLYDNNDLMNNENEVPDATKQSDNYLHLFDLPITIASLIKLSPLLKRQAHYCMLRFVTYFKIDLTLSVILLIILYFNSL